ncbi:hypothetical protein [Paraclostridium sordellii]|uniref:Uncharacterized protein n=1 Tax=Paraclostridium sordellii TaxID=1505 RepID=A0A9P1KZC1_PARSO|nr:hypothetical protein [Paeniclostridium sordellii]CEN31721.1 Uncharacterised protein [[Clostridium] sordellii] [Paeniclostridium sordellii]
MSIVILILFALFLIYFLSIICLRYSYISNLAIKNKLDFSSFHIRKNILNYDNSFNKITGQIALSLFKMYNRC